MLRWLVALLLVGNVVFFAWTRGWIDGLVGVRAIGDREPERLAKQVRPDSVRVLTPQAVAAAASAAEARLACFEAGPFDDGGVAAAEAALATALPPGTWSRITTERAPGWIIYMGRFPNRDVLQKKEQELARLKVDYEEMRNAAELEPGLMLGYFRERSDAAPALADLLRRGVQTARLVELSRASKVHMLRVDRADTDLAARVQSLRLDALGRGFVPCARPS
jgi:hypothetical protein